MPTKKEEVITTEGGLLYKGKPLLRKGNVLYYGNAEDKYIICMTVQETSKIMDLEVSSSVKISLQTNEAPGNERVIKKAERDGLYEALDLGQFWLEEILSEV